MASIKKLNTRKYKITVSNGYRPDGRKICKAKTVHVPVTVPGRGINQYVAHAAEEFERTVKDGYSEDGETTFEEYAERWLERQTKYAPSTLESYRRKLKQIYPHIGHIKLNRLRPIALENMLAKLRKRTFRGNRPRLCRGQKKVRSTIMASIRKRGKSYLLVVSMGYDHNGKRRNPQQKTVRPPAELTPKQREKWLNEQAVLFEKECRDTPRTAANRSITLAEYVDIWLRDIAPDKLAKSTLARDKQDIDRFLPRLGAYKLTELRPEHFRKLYADLRKVKSLNSGKPLSECTIEGVHACLCGILSDAMEGGFLAHNPAWRTYKYSGKRKEKIIADEETVRELIEALEEESLKYETYFKLIIATGMRRGECCGLKWSDIDYGKNSIHIQRNVVKITGEEIIVKDTKTAAGDRYVYFSPEMASLLKEYRRECNWQAEAYENRELTDDDYIFRKHDSQEPMTPSTFTWRFKLILKKHGLPEKLNVHSLRHPNVKPKTKTFSSF